MATAAASSEREYASDAASDAPRAPWRPHASDPTTPTISARALVKARGTVEDLVRSYFPLLGLPIDDVLCFADALYFIAASLYECDEANEAGGDPVGGGAWLSLEAFLSGRGLLCERVRAALDRGASYWRSERRLAAAWAAPVGGDAAEDALLAEATAASAAKSFDYEVLVLVVGALANVRPRVLARLELFNACFHLVEIEDDLRDYDADVASGAFNVFSAFARRRGRHAEVALRAWIARAEARYRAALGALDARELAFHVDRNEAQGGAGPAMAPRTGRWVVPAVVRPPPARGG